MTALASCANRWQALRSHPGYRRRPSAVLARAASWAVHCALGIPARARFRRLDFTLYLPPRWRGGGSTSPYLFREDYEPELALLERFLRPGMTFVDGGANTGVFTFAAARLVGPGGCVLAFEPGRECFAALQQSVRINDCRHVELRNEALSDRRSTARLYHHNGQQNSYSLGRGIDGAVGFDEVQTGTLDEALARSGGERLDFIKLDVEGAEELVLRGGRESIIRCQPIVLFEINPEACQRLSLAEDGAWSLLAGLGYRFFEMHGDDLRPLDRPRGFGNVLAVPAGRILDGDHVA